MMTMTETDTVSVEWSDLYDAYAAAVLTAGVTRDAVRKAELALAEAKDAEALAATTYAATVKLMKAVSK